jgi:hypothetical protein
VDIFLAMAVEPGAASKTPELTGGAIGQDFCEKFDLALEVLRGGVFL